MNSTREQSTLRSLATRVVLALAWVGALSGCAAVASGNPTQAELAQLRKEHEELEHEVEMLRAEVRGRLAALEGRESTVVPAPRLPQLPARPPLDRATLSALLDAYREALEAEDLSRLESQVYGGDLPTEDARLFGVFFDNAYELEVILEHADIDLVGDGATARLTVTQTMRYRLRRTAEPRNVKLGLLMVFQPKDGAWRLRNVSRR
ncbi:MAG: hypothetical protein Q8W48_03820 [Candidatus Palauibacterales bacterium]|nr:hypothetical protein [Candidatus Palauibacterales bacterium]